MTQKGGAGKIDLQDISIKDLLWMILFQKLKDMSQHRKA